MLLLLAVFVFGLSGCQEKENEAITPDASASNENEVAVKSANATQNQIFYNGSVITDADYEELLEGDVVSIFGLADTFHLYVFDTNSEAISWASEFGQDADALIKEMEVAALLGEFAEANDTEADFELIGQVPTSFHNYMKSVYLEHYGVDIDMLNRMRLEAGGFLYSGCYWTGTNWLITFSLPFLTALDKQISSFSIVHIGPIGFHEKRFFRGNRLWITPFGSAGAFQVSFCNPPHTAWNNRARSVSKPTF
ncbi:MAG: hypothetical protein JJT94_17420 [Bernardetiaceae bacterium]|nr:hypothetical protein [Bernardetiaceae bacterium]